MFLVNHLPPYDKLAHHKQRIVLSLVKGEKKMGKQYIYDLFTLRQAVNVKKKTLHFDYFLCPQT